MRLSKRILSSALLRAAILILIALLVSWWTARHDEWGSAREMPDRDVSDAGDRRPAAATPVEVPEEPATAETVPAGALIAGTVYLASPPAPAAGARVAALRSNERGSSAVVTASADGAYELAGLQPGRYRVVAWRGSWSTSWLPPQQREIPVAAGEEVHGVDRVLVRGAMLAGRVVEQGSGAPIAGAVRGRVSQNGVGLGGARILVTPAGEERAKFQSRSDEAGEFSFEGLAPGLYTVKAVARGDHPLLAEGVSAEIHVGDAETWCELVFGGAAIRGVVVDPEGILRGGGSVGIVGRSNGAALEGLGREGRSVWLPHATTDITPERPTFPESDAWCRFPLRTPVRPSIPTWRAVDRDRRRAHV